MKKVGLASKVAVGACACMLALGLAACGSNSSSDSSASSGSNGDSASKSITIGTSQNAQKLAESGVETLEGMGYEVNVQVFDDFQSPDRALDEGQVDANLYQHVPFMEEFNANNGTDLVMLDPVLWNFFTGLYSDKYTSIDDIPEGGLIGIANDASNIDIELKYMQEWGMIELADTPADGSLYTELDITNNPKNLQFIKVDDTQRYANSDEYDAFIGASDGLFQCGFNPNERLIVQKIEDETAIGLCVNAADKDSQLAKDLMTAYTSESAVNYVNDEMGGAFVLTDAAKKLESGN